VAIPWVFGVKIAVPVQPKPYSFKYADICFHFSLVVRTVDFSF
jgi:hypothetical protein